MECYSGSVVREWKWSGGVELEWASMTEVGLWDWSREVGLKSGCGIGVGLWDWSEGVGEWDWSGTVRLEWGCCGTASEGVGLKCVSWSGKSINFVQICTSILAYLTTLLNYCMLLRSSRKE